MQTARHASSSRPQLQCRNLGSHLCKRLTAPVCAGVHAKAQVRGGAGPRAGHDRVSQIRVPAYGPLLPHATRGALKAVPATQLACAASRDNPQQAHRNRINTAGGASHRLSSGLWPQASLTWPWSGWGGLCTSRSLADEVCKIIQRRAPAAKPMPCQPAAQSHYCSTCMQTYLASVGLAITSMCWCVSEEDLHNKLRVQV